MEVLQNETIDKKIDGFLNYCEMDTSNLNNKKKLSALREKKIALEVDMDISYDKATNTTDEAEQDDCIKRVEADQRTISELNICINYLKKVVKSERKISLKRKKVQSSNIGLRLSQKVKTIFRKK